MATRKALISPGFGAGWSTWIGSTPEQTAFALFDQPLIEAIERGEDIGARGIGHDPAADSPLADFERRFCEQFGEDESPYLGGARDLEVVEVEGQFRVDEYDGSESIIRRDEAEGWF